MANSATPASIQQKKSITVGQTVVGSLPSSVSLHVEGAKDTTTVPQVSTTPAAPTNIITKFQFRKLFKMEERILIDNAQYNNAFTGTVKATIATMQKDLEVSGEVDLLLPDTIAGVNYLQSVGILSAARAQRILNNLPPL